MGVIRFREFFEATFPDAVYPVPGPEEFDHVLIDLNSVVHQSCAQSTNEEGVITQVFETLDDLLEVAVPVKTVNLCLDGPAPHAKLMLQRQRRAQKQLQPTGWFPSYRITAGSAFMTRLEKALEYYCCRCLAEQHRSVQFHISGARVPGEGETKMLQHLRRGTEGRPESLTETVCLVGGDSDLLLTGLACTWMPNVYWLNTSTQTCYSIARLCADWSHRAETQKAKAEGEADEAVVAGRRPKKRKPSVLQVVKELLAGVPANAVSNVPRSDGEQKAEESRAITHGYYLPGTRLDLAVLATLRGTDYLPAVEGLQLKALWEAYAGLRRTKYAGEALLGAQRGRLQFNVPFLSAVLAKGAAEGTARAMGFRRRSDADAGRYLQGVLWTVASLAQGGCCDYAFVYGRDQAPGVEEIIDMLKSEDIRCPAASHQPLAPLANLIALLPSNTYKELPRPFADLLVTFSKQGATEEEKKAALLPCSAAKTALSPQDFRARCTAVEARLKKLQAAQTPASLARAVEDVVGLVAPECLDAADVKLLEVARERCLYLGDASYTEVAGATLASYPKPPFAALPKLQNISNLKSKHFDPMGPAVLPLQYRGVAELTCRFLWDVEAEPVRLPADVTLEKAGRKRTREAVEEAEQQEVTPEETARDVPHTKQKAKKKKKEVRRTPEQQRLGGMLVTDLLSLAGDMED
eukprot:EG_transcript_4369